MKILIKAGFLSVISGAVALMGCLLEVQYLVPSHSRNVDHQSL
jgi:hypothetical protein